MLIKNPILYLLDFIGFHFPLASDYILCGKCGARASLFPVKSHVASLVDEISGALAFRRVFPLLFLSVYSHRTATISLHVNLNSWEMGLRDERPRIVPRSRSENRGFHWYCTFSQRPSVRGARD